MKIDIDWERVYSGFVASGLSLREFHRLHLQCFFPGASLPALSSLARHMRLFRQRQQGKRNSSPTLLMSSGINSRERASLT